MSSIQNYLLSGCATRRNRAGIPPLEQIPSWQKDRNQQSTLQTKTAENCCNPYNVLLLNILIPHLLAAFLLFHVTLSHTLIYPISRQTSLIDPNQFILSFSATLPLKLNNLFCSFSFSLSSFTYTQHPHLLIIPYQLTSPRLKKTVLLLIRESRAVLTSCPITETPRPD